MTDRRMVVNVEVAIVRDGRYLMIERGTGEAHGAGWLSFPGGTMEPEVLVEALEETARREVREEVGLDLLDLVYVESHTFALEGGVVLDVVMIARAPAGEPVSQNPEEVASLAWMTLDQVRAHPQTQSFTLASLDLCEKRRTDLGW